VFAWFTYRSYQDRIEEQLLSFPEQVRPYVDFAPFTGSREGVLLTIAGSLFVETQEDSLMMVCA
jgi:hypothetical protein